MTKFLNLDELADAVKRTVTVGGKSYSVLPVSVGDFIEEQRKAARALKQAKEAKNDGDIEEAVDSFEGLLEIVRKAVPDMPNSTITGLGFQQLKALVQFIRDPELGTDEEGAAGK